MIGVPFLDLKHGQCKFALGSIDDPPALFCGEASATGSPYCAAHHAICYPPRAKNERGGRGEKHLPRITPACFPHASPKRKGLGGFSPSP
ncbi:GcrA family cell cycle regulator [Methylocystis sp. ATCC 49242]|uniref:GcrA family cell cycle regulator n=1 Tax=Methylocystis sp. ATCC 49242 TaxID=622637 RepID=UPI0001F87E83